MSLCLRDSRPTSRCDLAECIFFTIRTHNTGIAPLSLSPCEARVGREPERGAFSGYPSPRSSPRSFFAWRGRSSLGTEISNHIPRSRWFPLHRVTGWVRGSCFSSRRGREGRKENIKGEVRLGTEISGPDVPRLEVSRTRSPNPSRMSSESMELMGAKGSGLIRVKGSA